MNSQRGAGHQRFTIRPSAAALGADVEGFDARQPLDELARAEFVAAWRKHLVLRIRGQIGLEPEQLIAFSRQFGELDKRPVSSGQMSEAANAYPAELTIISNVLVSGKPIGGLGDAESVWHADMTYLPVPPKAACLHAVEIPPSGGDTYFTNMFAAYAAMPEPLRAKVRGLHCVHDASRNSAGQLRNGFKDITDPRDTVGAVHPIVCVEPESGDPYLLLGRRRGAYIQGLAVTDSEALLDELWAHAAQPQFSWRQQWQLGDIVMWDNRFTMHRRDSFDPSTRRLMHRTQIAGRAPAQLH